MNNPQGEIAQPVAAPTPTHPGASSVKLFAMRVLLFSLPILLVIGALELAFWSTGETVPVATIIERQRKNPETIWLRGYFDQALYAFKWRGFQTHKPRIVALGSSRVMKFRAEMFGSDATRFYNAGGLIQNVEDLNAFANALTPENTPQVALIGVDFWWLNEGRRAPAGFFPDRLYDGALDWRAHWLTWREMLTKPKRGKPKPLKILWKALRSPDSAHTLGIKARFEGGGFRVDGSASNESNVPLRVADWKLLGDEWQERITQGKEEGIFTRGVSAKRLARLRTALTTLQSKGVTVLVFNPPLISTHARLMDSMPQHRRFWKEYQTLVPQLCRELKIPFCDATTPQKLGLDDYYMADAVHAEETFHLHILRNWMKNPTARRALPDASKVAEAILRSPRTHFWQPDYSASPFAGPSSIQPGGQPSARPPKT